MARIRCLHLADLHLGWAPQDWGGREAERRQERDGILKKVVDPDSVGFDCWRSF
jgi:hypothetical protein